MRFLMQESFSRRGQVYVTPGALELLELSVLFRDRLEDALDYLTTDLAEIRYRNDLFRDLMEQPALLQELSGLYQALRTLMSCARCKPARPRCCCKACRSCRSCRCRCSGPPAASATGGKRCAVLALRGWQIRCRNTSGRPFPKAACRSGSGIPAASPNRSV